MFKCEENYKSIYLQRSSNTKSNKEIHTKAHHNLVAESQWQSESHSTGPDGSDESNNIQNRGSMIKAAQR